MRCCVVLERGTGRVWRRGECEDSGEAGREISVCKQGVELMYCWLDGWSGLDCDFVVILDDLFAKSKTIEVVAVYLDEVGESDTLEAYA